MENEVESTHKTETGQAEFLAMHGQNMHRLSVRLNLGLNKVRIVDSSGLLAKGAVPQ